MSRIGKKPINIPEGVKINLTDTTITVEGKKGKLSIPVPPLVEVKNDNGVINVLIKDEKDKSSGAMQGLARSLINNLVVGVTEGFKKELEIVGVGYRANVSGKKLNLNLGYSHPIEYDIPEGITIKVTDNTKISVEGIDKQLVGETAAIIRRFRKPEPYKGKGIRYAGEYIAMKEGKSLG